MVLANASPFETNPVLPFDPSSVFNVAGGADPVAKSEDLVAKAEPALDDAKKGDIFNLQNLLGGYKGFEGIGGGDFNLDKLAEGGGMMGAFATIMKAFFGGSSIMDSIRGGLDKLETDDNTAVADAKAEETVAEPEVAVATTSIPRDEVVTYTFGDNAFEGHFNPKEFSFEDGSGSTIQQSFNDFSLGDLDGLNRFGSQEELMASFDREPKPEELVQGNDLTSNIGLG